MPSSQQPSYSSSLDMSSPLATNILPLKDEKDFPHTMWSLNLSPDIYFPIIIDTQDTTFLLTMCSFYCLLSQLASFSVQSAFLLILMIHNNHADLSSPTIAGSIHKDITDGACEVGDWLNNIGELKWRLPSCILSCPSDMKQMSRKSPTLKGKKSTFQPVNFLKNPNLLQTNPYY